MYKKTYKLVNIVAVALFVGVAAGCASNQAVEEARTMAESAQSDAAEARRIATEAASAAVAADSAAASAQETADRALNAANEAQACCDANNERLDRMFERSMAK